MQKSRRALRLYASVGRSHSEGASEFSELQAKEWKNVNAELLRQLGQAMEAGSTRLVARDVFALRDAFQAEWRAAEADLHGKQRELVFAAENGDFIRAAMLSGQLVVLKARAQACQAAHHELDDVVRQSRVADPGRADSPVTLSEEAPPVTVSLAKVIPMRKRGVG